MAELRLPIQPPLAPMLAKLANEIPVGDGWLYEPKWDGFRCIVFRDGHELVLSSRNTKPLNRYFPELVAALADSLPQRCVIDGEIVVPAADDRGLDFDALCQRIHPAPSRVALLAQRTPASFVAFDLLAVDDERLLDEPLRVRHQRLRQALAAAQAPLYLCPSTTSPTLATEWFHAYEGAGLDGVVAKRLADPYTPDKRTLVKVKHTRTADCVVAGYRMHKDGAGVGSLLLGLYDAAGTLHHVGVVASFSAARRTALLAELAPLERDALHGHPWRGWADHQAEAHSAGRTPGGGSRWNAGKDLSWHPLRVERVAEVTFGQLQEGRFRHGSTFLRWRPDRLPEQCTYDQLEVADPRPFADIVGAPQET